MNAEVLTIHSIKTHQQQEEWEVARINVDDELYADFRFKRLLRKIDEDRAIGMLVRFWRIAQKYWGNNKSLIPFEEFAFEELHPILECGLAERRENGIYAKGAEDHFSWYLQKIEASRKGVEARQNKVKPGSPKLDSGQPEQNPGQSQKDSDQSDKLPGQPEGVIRLTGNNTAVNPLAPAPALAPVTVNLSLSIETEILKKFPNEDLETVRKAIQHFEKEKKDLRGKPIQSLNGYMLSCWSEIRLQFLTTSKDVKVCVHKNLDRDPFTGISKCLACKQEFKRAQ